MTVTAMMRIDEKVCFISMYQNVQKGDVARKRILAFTADFKIEKCRTKAADLRRLCSTFNAIQEENIFSPLLYCNSVVAIASSAVVSALPSLFGSMLQATDAITK